MCLLPCWNKISVSAHWNTVKISSHHVPFTTSLADVFKCSTENVKVAVSSTDRLEIVRLWTCPLALIRKWLVGLSWIPFLIQVPVTWGWESSTSKDAVSLSVVLMSISSLLILIFRAVRKVAELCSRHHSSPTSAFSYLLNGYFFVVVKQRSCLKDWPQLQIFSFRLNREQTWCPFSVTK